MRVWLLWEAIWTPRLRPIRKEGLLRYSLTRHHGHRVQLNDGVTVRHGDRLVELHLDNRTLLRLAGGGIDSFGTERLGTAEFRELARMIRSGSLGPIAALHALTPFAPALRRQGFELRPVPHTWGYALTRFYMTGLLALYHPEGWAAVTPQRARRWPTEVWMSRERFLDRMGEKPAVRPGS